MARTARHPIHRGLRHLARLGPAAVLVLATGCGGFGSEQQSAVEAWADDVCASVSDWKGAVEDAQATLGDPVTLSADDVRNALNSVVSATTSFVNDLKGMGPPDTEAGQAAADELSILSGKLQHQADVVTQAMDESSTNLQELLAQVSTVSGAISRMVGDSVAAVENIEQLDGAAELESAFQEASACQELRAGDAPGGG